MIKKHLITKEHKQDIIYLYLDNKYEIATDLYITKDNPTLINNIYNYLSNNNISYKHKDIFLVIDNIIVAKLNKKFLSNKLKYLELIHYGKTSYNDNLDDYPSIKFIDIVNSEKIIKKVKFNINLENIIKKENIDDFNLETLKVKTVLLRTKLLKNKNIKSLNEIQISNNSNKLIKQAIKETDNEIIKYKKHKSNKNLLRYRKITNDYLSHILNINIDKNTKIEINDNYLLIDNKYINKKELSNKLYLSSSNFNISINDNYTIFIDKKYGNIKPNIKSINNLVKKGYTHKEILNYFYPNTYISKFS